VQNDELTYRWFCEERVVRKFIENEYLEKHKPFYLQISRLIVVMSTMASTIPIKTIEVDYKDRHAAEESILFCQRTWNKKIKVASTKPALQFRVVCYSQHCWTSVIKTFSYF
jgi:hypothetical protein